MSVYFRTPLQIVICILLYKPCWRILAAHDDGGASKINAAHVSDNEIDTRSFYEISQSLIMGRSSEHCISATVRDGRFVSSDSLWEVDGPVSNAAVGSEL
jgi:hypothetical protein